MTNEESRGVELRRLIAEQNPEAVLWDNCDAAIIGTVSRCGSEPVVCYDYDKLIECFIDPDLAESDPGAAHEEALEWVEYNVAGAYVGENTPFILVRLGLHCEDDA